MKNITIDIEKVEGKFAEYLALEALEIYNATQMIRFMGMTEEEENKEMEKECHDAIEMFEKAIMVHEEKKITKFLKEMKEAENKKPWTLGIYNPKVVKYMAKAYRIYNDIQVEKDTPENIKKYPIADEIIELAEKEENYTEKLIEIL